MRFQPIIVPSPSAIATATFTQLGMNLVELSSSFLYSTSVCLVRSGYVDRLRLAEQPQALAHQIHFVADVDHAAPAGTLSSELTAVTCCSDGRRSSAASAGKVPRA